MTMIAIEHGCSKRCRRARANSLYRSGTACARRCQPGGELHVDLDFVLSTIVAKATQLSRTDAGAIYVFDEADQQFRLRATYGLDETSLPRLRTIIFALAIPPSVRPRIRREPI